MVESQYLEGRATLNCSDKTAAEIDNEVVAILKESYETALRLLRENRELLDKLAEFLIEKETITGKQFMEIFRREKGIPEPEQKEQEPAVQKNVMPETMVSETTVAETMVEETTVPESAAPESVTEESATPDSTIRESAAQETQDVKEDKAAEPKAENNPTQAQEPKLQASDRPVGRFSNRPLDF